MAAYLEDGGQHDALGAKGVEGGVAGCREPAGDGPGGAGEVVDRQRQGLRCVHATIHDCHPPPGAAGIKPPVHARQAVDGGGGPQEGHGANRALAVTSGVARCGAGCPSGAPHTSDGGRRPALDGTE